MKLIIIIQPSDKCMEEELNLFVRNWIKEIQMATKTSQPVSEEEIEYGHSSADTIDDSEDVSQLKKGNIRGKSLIFTGEYHS